MSTRRRAAGGCLWRSESHVGQHGGPPAHPVRGASSGHHQHRHGCEHPSRRTEPRGRSCTDEAAHARQQRSTAGGHRHADVSTSHRFHVGQRSRVEQRIAAGQHREIVAAVFAFDADDVRHPPHRRVIEEEALDGRLHEIDQIVVTPDVCELVRDDRFDLARRQAGECRDRQEQHGNDRACHHGHVDSR